MESETAEDRCKKHFLYLNEKPVRFEPVSKLTNVFFDDASRQVFTVRSGGATGVVVKGPDERTSANFRMEDKGDVICIKFSPDQSILAIQRSQKSVEFVNFSGQIDSVEYSQSCKGKSTKVLGFVWTNVREVAMVTDHGIELYQVLPEKQVLRCLKTHGVSVVWFVYHPETSILLLASGSQGNVLHPFQFRQGNVFRLPKFEVDLPALPNLSRVCLLERDVVLATLYRRARVVVLRHRPRGAGNAGAEIIVYTFQKEGPPRKTDVLKLDASGRFAVNMVDDLVVIHHRNSKTSMLFDVCLPGDSDGFTETHVPLVPPSPIRPFMLKVPSVPVHSISNSTEVECELYSPYWVVFQPDVVIDAKLGCLWYVQLDLDPLVDLIADKCRLVDFLLLRRDSKDVLLKVCRQCLSPQWHVPLASLGRIFDKLNAVCKQHRDLESLPQGSTAAVPLVYSKRVMVDQSDMYTHVFSVFLDAKDIPYKFVVSVLVEYIRSLTQHQLPVQHYLYEMLINSLVEHKSFYQLHQFLQYHILSDSKPLACLMLSLQSQYPPAHQLALDMLKRLGTANDEIVEVLLSQKQVLPALRFIRMADNIDTISARKFLDVAYSTKDSSLFYAVFKFFELRNIRLRGSPAFAQGEHCEPFVKHFEKLFGVHSSCINFSNVT